MSGQSMAELMSLARVPRATATALPGLRAVGPPLLVGVAVAAIIAAAATTSTLVPMTLAIAGIGAVAACLRRPGVAIVALVAFLPLNDVAAQLLGPGTAAATVVGAVKDLLLVAMVFALLLGHRQKGAAYPASLSTFLALTLGIGAAAAVATGDVLEALYGWRNDFEPLLLLAVIPLLVTEATTRRVLTAIVVAGEAASALAIATHQMGLSWLLGLRLDQSSGASPIPPSYFSAGSIVPRAFSPYVAPNELGVACVLVLAVILYRRDWPRARRTALALLPLVALFLTASRSAWIGLGVLVVFEVVRLLRSKRLMPVRLATLVLAGGAGAAALALLLGSRDPSVSGHAASLSQSVGLLLAHPLGLGTGSVGPRAMRFGSSAVLTESYFLLIALEAGALALLCYVALMVSAGTALVGARTAPDADVNVLSMGVAVLVASLPNQLVLPTLQDGAVSWLLWIIVGVSISHALRVRGGSARDRDRDTSLDRAQGNKRPEFVR